MNLEKNEKIGRQQYELSKCAVDQSIVRDISVADCPVDYDGLDVIRNRLEYWFVAGLIRYGFTCPLL